MSLCMSLCLCVSLENLKFRKIVGRPIVTAAYRAGCPFVFITEFCRQKTIEVIVVFTKVLY